MSEVRADTISNGAGTGPATLTKQWASKMWANLNGTGTIALRDSENVSSVVDVGIGAYGFNMTSAFQNTNHVRNVTGDATSVAAVGTTLRSSVTASYFIAYLYSSTTGVANDMLEAMISTYGDLA
jgi:tetrahydromethanopterin S-methyltransferase subunit H